MTILDRYLTKQILFPIFFCSCTLIFLVYMSDLFDNLDEMIRNKTHVLLILKYYLALLPEMFVNTISWACLLGSIYVFTAFNYHNELTAMKVSGLEITSIARPVVFVGFIIGIMAFITSDRIVPITSPMAQRLLMDHIQKKSEVESAKKVFENVTYYGGTTRLYYAREFNLNEQIIHDFIVLWLDAKKQVKKKTVAREARWNGTAWELRHATDYNLERTGVILGEPLYREQFTYSEIAETPEEFRKAASEGINISYQDLKEHIQKLKENGVKLTTEPVALHYKLASPWNSLVVMCLVIPLLARTCTRRMIAVNVLICLGFVFLFHVSGAVMLALGKAGKLFPLVSAWAHSLIFGFGTFYFLDHANH
jgi:lipopolysaccharide export system permease protein